MGKKRKKTKAKTRFKALKITLITILSLFILAAVTCTGVVFAIIKNAPPLNVNQLLTLDEPSALYDNQNQFMDMVITNQQRKVISYKDMPQNLRNAFISIEDERFYKHKGVDVKRIVGVALIDVKNKLTRQSGIQGASTITQQLLKNTLLSSEVSFKRKIQEIYLAIQLEKYLSKDQILQAYMNTIYLGGKSWGVEAASEQYFNKSAKDLSLVECAYMAGIPQSPSVYYPFSAAAKKNPSLYLNRTRTVLKKMYENGYITAQDYNGALTDLSNNKLVFKSQNSNNGKLNYEYFTLPAVDQVKKALESQYHYTESQAEHQLMYGGLKIYTTMDRSIQDNTQQILNNTDILGSNSSSNVKQPQASAVIMDYHTGEVKCIIGGRGDQPARSYNRAASDNFLRPTGSSIKPLTVYGPAIDSKEYTAASIISDSPLSSDISQKYGSNGEPYTPKDDDTNYMGNITLRTALTHSRNLSAVKIEDKLGLSTGIDYAQKFGLTLDEHDKTSIAALSLGQLHHGANPLTMAAAYGVFGNNGTYTSPKLYTKVVDRSGKVILQNETSTTKVLSSQSAYIMYDLLKGPVSAQGTGSSANLGDMPTRGKTGTSTDSKDLWFCGLTPYYSAAVWIGNDDNSVIPGYNSNTSASLWAAIMKPIHQNLSPKDIDMPDGITTEPICELSGKLASSICYGDPDKNTVYNEFFIDGTQPTSYCNLSHSSSKTNSFFGNSILKKFRGNKNSNNDTDNNSNNVNDYLPQDGIHQDTNTNNNTGTDTNVDANKNSTNTKKNTSEGN